ncbi:MAG: MarR family transcriptional regulator [Rhodobacteraceae bacterium]|nr:MarR family transcriptional regulator [Paracoccaceae bacterium]
MPNSTPCPAQYAVDLFGGKWKTSILYQIALAPEPLRFNVLRRKIPRITQKMLTQQLRQMERDGLVVRTFYPEVPARVEYTLSLLGKTLTPIFEQLCGWSADHKNSVEQARMSYVSIPSSPVN